MKLAFAVAALALTGCKRTGIDMDLVKGLAVKSAADVGVTGAVATCPDQVPSAIGTKFVCSVAIGGKSYDLDGTIQPPPGQPDSVERIADLKWHDGLALGGATLEKLLTPKLTEILATPVKVACGGPIRFIQPDHTITCDLTAGKHAVKVATSFDANNETTSFDLVPSMLGKAKLEGILTKSVTDKLAAASTVTCGDDPLIERPADGKLLCTVDSGSQHGGLAVAVDADFKITGWEIVAAAK
jgi:hypothetical protein